MSEKKKRILIALITLACFLVCLYFIYYFVVNSSRAGSGSVTLDSQADWLEGSYDARLDLTTSPGDIEINLLNPNWGPATAAAGWSQRRLHGSAVFDNKIWVLGGEDGSAVEHNDVWYSLDGATWTETPPSDRWSERAVHNVLVYNNELWVLGGADNSDNNLNDVWHSSDGISWTRATAAADWSPRRAAGAVVFGGKMWIFGGWDAGGPATRYDDVWYSTNGINWTQIPDPPGWTPRHAFSYAVFDSKIWLFGGDDTTFKSDIWNSTNGISWTEVASSSSWGGRIYSRVVAYGGRLWLLGGIKLYPYYNNDVWYSADGVSWTQTTNAAIWTARGYFGAEVFDDNIYVTGGAVSGSLKNDVWYTTWSGTHLTATSQIIASANLTNWTTFEPQATVPADASISFNFRTSANGSAWTGWSVSTPYAASIDISDQEGSSRYFQVLTTLSNDDGLSTPSLSSYTVNFETSGSSLTPTPSSPTLSPTSSSPTLSPTSSSSPDLSEIPQSGFLDWINPFSKNKTGAEKIIYWIVLSAIIALAVYFFIWKKYRTPK